MTARQARQTSLLLNYGVAEMLVADLNPEACARLSQRGGQPASS